MNTILNVSSRIWVTGSRLQNTGLHDLAAQPTFDHDLTAEPAIDRHTGGKNRQAEEAEPPGQGRPLALAGGDFQRRAAGPHPVQIDDPLDF